MMDELDRFPLQHIPKILNSVKVWTVWQPIHIWILCLMLPEPPFYSLSLMNPGIITILEYFHTIREEKFSCEKNLFIFVYSGYKMSYFFLGT